MRRHEALIPLTHDHHHALVQVRRLRSAADGAEGARRAAAEGFLEFFHEDTIGHFRDEEEVVFPLVAGVAELREPVDRALAEHVAINVLVRRLAGETNDGAPQAGTLREIAGTLERHVRFEEKELFPLIEERAQHGALEAVHLAPRNRDRAAPGADPPPPR